MTEDERLKRRLALDESINRRIAANEYRLENGDPYLNGLVWAIGFIYRFAFVSAILLVSAYFLGRAIHGPGPARSFKEMAVDLARIRPALPSPKPRQPPP
jgi:hypothetical protein